MGNISKCPFCGKKPEELGRDSYGEIGITCCGVTIWDKNNPILWNKYSASMNYAMKTSEWFRIDPEKSGGLLADQLAEELMAEAQEKMLEVFK